ncbi:MAG: ABC transporter substrate-binding protein [Desulfobacteraceae bacterium]|nr:ABC transporter substrate-binding protein [Desulfobacteraceae bacterium]
MKKTFYCLHFFVLIFISTAYAEETIKIAAIFGLTGVAAEGYKDSIKGVQIAEKEVNAHGGVLGKKINLVILDNLSTPIGSSIAAENAAKLNVAAIIGPTWSSHAIAAAKTAQAEKIPMLSEAATNPKVTKTGDYIFRMCYTDDFQGRVMAEFARHHLKADTAIILNDVISDYSITLTRTFQSSFEKLGGKILLELKYKHKQKKFSNLIAQAKKTESDVLFIPGHHESGQIIKEAADAGISAVPLGGDGWDFKGFLSKGGKHLKQGYYCSHWSEAMNSDVSRSFVKKYKLSGDIFPGTALAYDAVMLLSDAIKRAGSADRAKIRDAIADTRNFKGVTGTISFDSNGDPIKRAVIIEIRKGNRYYFKTTVP